MCVRVRANSTGLPSAGRPGGFRTVFRHNVSRRGADGTLAFLMAELSALPAAAVVVEDRYSAMPRAEHVEPGWLAELVARVQVRYPSVPVVFCEGEPLAYNAGAAMELAPTADAG